MAGKIVRATGATFDTVTIDGVRLFEYSVEKQEKRGRSDAQLGETTADKIGERLTCRLAVDDEDGFAASLLMTGADGVLVVTYKEDSGGTGTITIGVSGDNSGVVFNRAAGSYDNAAGRPGEVVLEGIGRYHADHTKTIGDNTEFSAGTCLMKIISS